MKKAVQIDEKDNVATVTSKVDAGESIEVLSPVGDVIKRIEVLDLILFGHKIALVKLDRGEKVSKYGETIGLASKSIREGDWVHVHNVESAKVPTSTFKEEYK